jgi:hypothetical protein
MSLPAKVYGSVTAIYAILFLACATAFGKFFKDFSKPMKPYTTSLGVLPRSHQRRARRASAALLLQIESDELCVWSALRAMKVER